MGYTMNATRKLETRCPGCGAEMFGTKLEIDTTTTERTIVQRVELLCAEGCEIKLERRRGYEAIPLVLAVRASFK